MASGGNIFAALTKSKSKKQPKEKKEERASDADKHAALEAAIFSSGTGGTNWADESDEEDEWGGHHHAGHGHEEGWEAVSGPGRAHRCGRGVGDPHCDRRCPGAPALHRP